MKMATRRTLAASTFCLSLLLASSAWSQEDSGDGDGGEGGTSDGGSRPEFPRNEHNREGDDGERADPPAVDRGPSIFESDEGRAMKDAFDAFADSESPYSKIDMGTKVFKSYFDQYQRFGNGASAQDMLRVQRSLQMFGDLTTDWDAGRNMAARNRPMIELYSDLAKGLADEAVLAGVARSRGLGTPVAVAYFAASDQVSNLAESVLTLGIAGIGQAEFAVSSEVSEAIESTNKSVNEIMSWPQADPGGFMRSWY